MSYSFSARGETKALALQAVAEEMKKIVVGQPVHAHDEEAVNKNAAAAVALLPDDETMDVSISCSGWLSWTGLLDAPDFKVMGASVNTCAELVVKAKK